MSNICSNVSADARTALLHATLSTFPLFSHHRPLNKGEKERGERRVVECMAERSEIVVPQPAATAAALKAASVGANRRFTYDKIFDVSPRRQRNFLFWSRPLVFSHRRSPA